MKLLLKALSFLALGLIFASAGLLFAGLFGRRTYEVLSLVGTAGWFATVPFWMRHRLHHSED